MRPGNAHDDGERRHGAGRLAGLLLLAVTLATGAAHAQDAERGAAVGKDIETYCTNIADAARDRRYLIQKKDLAALEAGIDDRMKALDRRRAEYEDWLTRRDDFLKAAKAQLVDIYTKMDPDAAARQLELMDPSIAAAIVMKLAPDKASAILNEMKADKAATLAGIIAAAGNPNTSRNPS